MKIQSMYSTKTIGLHPANAKVIAMKPSEFSRRLFSTNEVKFFFRELQLRQFHRS